MWQHRHIHLLAVLVSFVLPAAIGWIWDGAIGALGGFLIAGVARVTVLQHCTFLINSACHTLGRNRTRIAAVRAIRICSRCSLSARATTIITTSFNMITGTG